MLFRSLLIDEDRTAELQGGVAYGSETGLMGTLSLKDSNWRGKNQQFGFTFEKSNKDYMIVSVLRRSPIALLRRIHLPENLVLRQHWDYRENLKIKRANVADRIRAWPGRLCRA